VFQTQFNRVNTRIHAVKISLELGRPRDIASRVEQVQVSEIASGGATGALLDVPGGRDGGAVRKTRRWMRFWWPIGSHLSMSGIVPSCGIWSAISAAVGGTP
jgi:hypothetical protein